ncbi:hypothetical protein Fmac_008278 [Flemingia macrophylla]|uniref:Uncharacterized protein n=1 Tax=Flemingia macrophylla TaxID=520843 RepID=A0ABD1MY50_9FABA
MEMTPRKKTCLRKSWSFNKLLIRLLPHLATGLRLHRIRLRGSPSTTSTSTASVSMASAFAASASASTTLPSRPPPPRCFFQPLVPFTCWVYTV